MNPQNLERRNFRRQKFLRQLPTLHEYKSRHRLCAERASVATATTPAVRDERASRRAATAPASKPAVVPEHDLPSVSRSIISMCVFKSLSSKGSSETYERSSATRREEVWRPQREMLQRRCRMQKCMEKSCLEVADGYQDDVRLPLDIPENRAQPNCC